MKKYERVKSNLLFNKIIQNGKKVSNSIFTCFYIETNDKINHYGVSVPTKLGNAVVRNKLKRQTRSIIDQNNSLFKKRGNYIIINKERALYESYEYKNDSLIKLIGEINEK